MTSFNSVDIKDPTITQIFIECAGYTAISIINNTRSIFNKFLPSIIAKPIISPDCICHNVHTVTEIKILLAEEKKLICSKLLKYEG